MNIRISSLALTLGTTSFLREGATLTLWAPAGSLSTLTWLRHVSQCLLERPWGASSSKTQFWQRHSGIWSISSCHDILNSSPGAHRIIYTIYFFLSPKKIGSWHLFAVRNVFSNVLFSICAHRRSSARLPAWISALHFAASQDDSPHAGCDAGIHCSVTLLHFPEMCRTVFAAQRSSCISCLFFSKRARLKRWAHRCRLMQFVSVRSKWHVKARALARSQHSKFTAAASATPHPAAFVSRLFGIYWSTC